MYVIPDSALRHVNENPADHVMDYVCSSQSLSVLEIHENVRDVTIGDASGVPSSLIGGKWVFTLAASGK